MVVRLASFIGSVSVRGEDDDVAASTGCALLRVLEDDVSLFMAEFRLWLYVSEVESESTVVERHCAEVWCVY